MGISIYYEARRPGGMTERERQAIEAIVSRDSVEDRLEEHHGTGSGWNGEDFCLYEPPFDSPATILEGATCLPDQSWPVRFSLSGCSLASTATHPRRTLRAGLVA